MLNKENRGNNESSSQKKKLVTKTFVDKDGYNGIALELNSISF